MGWGRPRVAMPRSVGVSSQALLAARNGAALVGLTFPVEGRRRDCRPQLVCLQLRALPACEALEQHAQFRRRGLRPI